VDGVGFGEVVDFAEVLETEGRESDCCAVGIAGPVDFVGVRGSGSAAAIELVGFAEGHESGCSGVEIAEVVGLDGVSETGSADASASGCFAVGIAEVGDSAEEGGSAEVYEIGCSVVGIAEVVDFAVGNAEVVDSGGIHGIDDFAVGIAGSSEVVNVAEVHLIAGFEDSASGHQTDHSHYMHDTQQIAVCPASDSRSEACLQLLKYVLW
jgi:hypothetical protein